MRRDHIRFAELAPDAETLTELEPEELAWYILEWLKSAPETPTQRHNFLVPDNLREYPSDRLLEVQRALSEAWSYLESSGLIAIDPKHSGDWVFVTRRGQALQTPDAYGRHRRAASLPKGLIAAEVYDRAWPAYVRGNYDTAVFEAIKVVEVAIREACGWGPEVYGTDLARRAFHAETGPLRDESAPAGERQALSNLFAGALGSYKNPHSHRHIEIEAAEASEEIVLASHLWKIVADRNRRNLEL